VTGIADYRQAYADGATDPLRVADAFLAAQPVGGAIDAFITVDPDLLLAEAAESTRRLRDGASRGPLEGMLVGVKDFYDVRGYETRYGTTCMVGTPEHDSGLVARLRAAGAVFAGKTRGTELGLSPIGVNTSGGSPRNPHDLRRPAGGSSSGSAAAVAAGLVPLAVGSDGGGSLRIPPSVCGVLGLMPTYDRIPDDSSLSSGWWTLNDPGPIAGTVADLAEGYTVMADLPPLDLSGGDAVRVGVDWHWWGVPGDGVDRVCRAALNDVELELVELAHLELVRITEYVTIACEVAAAAYDHHREDPTAFGLDVQMILGLADEFTGVDYVRAQQARALIARTFAAAFEQVDVLVTPMLADTVPVLDDEIFDAGFMDEPLLRQLTAYAFPANLAGLPAMTLPVGVDDDGMPVGLQLVGRPDGEADLLRLAARLEADGRVHRPAPTIHHDLLTHVPEPTHPRR
jgi:aspartyl-tRNA(Asn)/glutamyl-tRNA(Gln) amidotransferase subunit A